jgi:TRAP-type uncharacterized transport system substrate-binding protein
MAAHRPSVTRQIRRTVVHSALSLRDMLASVGPVLLLAIGLLVAAYWWLDPQPPRSVTLATGPAGSAYAAFGQRYAEALAQDGIQVRLLPTDGTEGNLQALREGRADLAFVRGGSDGASDDAAQGITSLGALFYEPLWLFYRPAAVATSRAPAAGGHAPLAAINALTQLRGLRVSIDQPGSGVPDLVRRLLWANGLTTDELRLSEFPPEAAAEALLAGQIDALVVVSAPESAVVLRLLQAPGIALADLPQADALSRRFPFLQTVSLPRGMVDLATDLPPQDVGLLAATTALLTREDTHPALRQRFAQVAQQIHGGAGWFNGARDFPNTRTSELPVSPEGDRAINGNPPFWQRYLPFWASNLLERMWLVIGGLIVLLLPLSRIVPPLYTYRVRQRVFRWYARLREVEERMEARDAPLGELLQELDELDDVVSHLSVPLAHADELYTLRSHIEKTRRRLLTQAAEDGDAALTASIPRP